MHMRRVYDLVRCMIVLHNHMKYKKDTDYINVNQISEHKSIVIKITIFSLISCHSIKKNMDCLLPYCLFPPYFFYQFSFCSYSSTRLCENDTIFEIM